MKQDTLQHLLEKYREGTLSGEELSQLNSLAHKDEVLSAAHRQARGILVRRYTGRAGLALAALMLVGAGVWMMRPPSAEAPLVAETRPTTPSVASPLPAPPLEDTYQGRRGEEEGASKMLASNQLKTRPSAPEKALPAQKNAPVATPPVTSTHTVVHQSVEAVVTCNNQCEADSVINDIWKFLLA